MTNNILSTFEHAINTHEDQLFGIKLFMEGIKYLYGKKQMTTKNTNYHFQNIMERGEEAISKAKKLLEKVKSNTVDVEQLKNFQFPLIHGQGLDDLTQRATILVKTYNKLFPNRSRDLPLTTEEHIKLMQEAINNF